MTDIVEKVARAIAVRQNYDPDGRADEFGLAFKGFASGNLPCWHFFKNDATAAIEVMKEEGWTPPANLAEIIVSGTAISKVSIGDNGQIRQERIDPRDFYLPPETQNPAEA